MKFFHILTELYSKPCLILPEAHKQICDIVQAHLSGAAHAANGIADSQSNDVPDAFQRSGNVAIIPIQGVLDKRVSDMAKSSGAMGLDDIEDMLTEAMLDEEIKGILLDVNSPGGSVTGVPELAAKIAAAAKQKPVVAFTDSMMASAAYWLGAGASAIFASQSASVGSIGVYMAFLDESRAYEMQGLKMELIKNGKYKAAGIPGIPLSDEQRDRLQGSVDQVATWFKGFVSKHRETVQAETMEGQTFFGADAVKADLVDAVGTAADAMAELRSMIAARENV